jgi:phenylacetyl-CoA:acceptor oxidoreductase subunit 2
VTAVLAGLGGPSPAGRLAAWLGPLLVVAGFLAVATEAGRPWRGIRVLRRLRTSWMSREAWLGGAFVTLALVDRFVPLAWQHRYPAALAAVGLALAQGLIVQRARGVPAWRVPVVVPLFLCSAAVSGGGLYVLLEGLGGRAPAPGLAGALLAVMAVALGIWALYLDWPGGPAFVTATAALRQGGAVLGVVALGHAAPALALVAGTLVPALGIPAALVAGALMVLGQERLKAALILQAGRLQPVTVANLRLQRRVS